MGGWGQDVGADTEELLTVEQRVENLGQRSYGMNSLSPTPFGVRKWYTTHRRDTHSMPSRDRESREKKKKEDW